VHLRVSRRWLFPLLVLAAALVLWLLEDRLGLRAAPPPPARPTERAPDPRGFDMEMRPAKPAAASPPPAPSPTGK
jgi:hypothetical protein